MLPLLAGTQRCPECWGNPVVYRHTPNLRKVLNLEDPIFVKVQRGVGRYVTEHNFETDYSKVPRVRRLEA